MLAVACLAGALGLVHRLRSQTTIAKLETTLKMERQAAAEKLAEVEKTFTAPSSQALQNNSQAFLQLARRPTVLCTSTWKP